jgi:hypothetical protein
MNSPSFKPGDRIRFIDDPEDLCGTVRAATDEELAYVETWSSTARASVRGHILVYLDGDEPQDAGWTDPRDIQLA